MDTAKKKKKEPCDCNWDDCAWLSEQIETHAPENHVWRGTFHRWTEKKLSPRASFERMLFLASACQHIPGIEEAFKEGGRWGHKKNIVIARHHFPLCIYNYLGSRKVTTLLKEVQMEVLQENNIHDRLMDDCNRVEYLANLLKTSLLPPGKLLEDVVAREKECRKKQFFVCPPNTTRQEVVNELKAIAQREKDRQEKEQNEELQRTANVLASVAGPRPPSPLLPGASISTRAMAEYLRTANVLVSVAAPLNKETTANNNESVAETPTATSSHTPHETTTTATTTATATLNDNAATHPPNETAAEPPVALAPGASISTANRESPNIMPSVEQCVAKLQSKIKADGIEKASTTKNFGDAIQVLRFIYNDYTPIRLYKEDQEVEGYLCPCKDNDRNSTTCATFRVSSRYYREGMYCLPCRHRIDHDTRKRLRIQDPNLSLTEKRRVESLPREHLIQMVTEQRKINKNLKRQVQRAKTKTALLRGSSIADSDSSQF